MDTRTKQKHLRAVRLLMHALEGHRSSLPAGKSLATIITGGMAAAQALQDIRGTLTEAQAAIVSKTLTAELTKQGF